MSDDASDDDSIDDGTDYDGGYVKPTVGDSENAEATSDDYCCTGHSDRCFHLTGQDEVGQGKNFHTHSM
jgi:hypothetical protein